MKALPAAEEMDQAGRVGGAIGLTGALKKAGVPTKGLAKGRGETVAEAPIEVDWRWMSSRLAKGFKIGADGFGADRVVLGTEAAKRLFAKGLKLRAADGLKMPVVKKEEAVNDAGLRACCWKGTETRKSKQLGAGCTYCICLKLSMG